MQTPRTDNPPDQNPGAAMAAPVFKLDIRRIARAAARAVELAGPLDPEFRALLRRQEARAAQDRTRELQEVPRGRA